MRSEASKARRRIASNKWKRENPERAKRNLARWHELNAEHRAKWVADYLKKTKERRKLYDAERYLRPDNIARREAKKAERKAYNAGWNRKNKHKHRATEGKREALKKKNGVGDVRLIAKWIKSWTSLESVVCYWCLKSFTPKECESDHIIAIAKGGRHSIENLCISCEPCNMSKHDRSVVFWNRLIEQPVLLL